MSQVLVVAHAASYRDCPRRPRRCFPLWVSPPFVVAPTAWAVVCQVTLRFRFVVQWPVSVSGGLSFLLRSFFTDAPVRARGGLPEFLLLLIALAILEASM